MMDANKFLISRTQWLLQRLERIEIGWSLSLYLFIVMMDILSRMLRRAEDRHLIKGVKISRGNDSLNYPFFVDDLVVLIRVTRWDANNCRIILDTLCSWSGLLINFNKLGLFFSIRVKNSVKANLKSTCNVKKTMKWQNILAILFS